MRPVFFGMYIPLYTKSSVEKCGVASQNGEWARCTYIDIKGTKGREKRSRVEIAEISRRENNVPL
jgi:hypothetical protein